MDKSLSTQPDYGNWVSSRLIYISGGIGLLFLLLAFILPALLILAVLFWFVAAYFAYARYLFSATGGDIQARIWDLALSHLEWDGAGQALDIGCGNAPLTIRLAQKYPQTRVIGVDYWGASWEYSKTECEQNARVAGVGEQVSFQKASAAALPFEDEHFEAAVSNLTFHEVSDAPDKRQVIREALRVVKKGGKFSFQDLFLVKQQYGEIDDLLATVRSWGVAQVAFEKTGEASFIPAALKLPFMVGTIGILYGEK
jgi:SAM-dependent methyltransferase